MPRGVKQHSLAFTAASAQRLGPNAARKAIFLSGHTTDAVAIAFGEDAAINKGFSIPALAAGIWITEELIGDDIHKAIYGISSGAVSVGIAEISGD